MTPGSDQAVEAVRAFILELRKIREVVVLEPPAGRELEFLAFRAQVAADVAPALHELRSEIDALIGAVSAQPTKRRDGRTKRNAKGAH
jgi:hypothetical protein